MSKLKSFDEFVNENLVIGGNYSYFGQGSLEPIIQKLIGEGKNESIIRSYLTSLGVESWRIDKAMAKFGGVEFAGERNVTEAAKKATFEDKANKFLNDLNEEEDEVNEAQKFKGKEIFPNWVKARELKGMIRKESDLTKGARYALLDLGLDVWQAEYEYEGKVGPMHIFKSTAQGTGDDSNIEFSDAELKDAVKNAEVVLMEATTAQINEAKINKNAKRSVRPFNKVKPGNVALDYNDEPYTVVGVGKASELYDFDDSGIAADEMDPDEDAIAVVGTIGRGGAPAYAVYSYMPDGAVVYESEDDSIDEAKKKTFEDAAAAFLLGLVGSDQIDEEDKEKVDEKLNKETLQVEGDGEDIDDMIDDLADGDEDEFQGADDEAPESESDEDKEDDSTDLDKAVKSAKKDKAKLDKIKDILMGEAEEVELDADGEEEKDKEDIEDEETGDEVEVEEPADESEKVDEADDEYGDDEYGYYESTNESLKGKLKALYKAAQKKFGKTKIVPPNDADYETAEKYIATEYGEGHSLFAIGVDKIQDVINIQVGDDKTRETEDIVIDRPATNEADEWSDDVKTKWTPPAGLFTEPAAKIVDVLYKDSEDLDQAMSRLMFYINRAGKLLSPKDKANLELAKKLLQKKYA